MGIKLFKGSELKAKMKGFKTRVKSWTEYVASIGVSVVVHAAEHGDVSLLQQFYEHLPAAYTRPFTQWLGANGVAEWLAFANGTFSLKKTDEAKEARKAFAENPPVEDWTDFRVRRETSFDLENVAKRLEGILKKAEETGIILPEDAQKGITMALAATMKAIANMKNAVSA